MDSLDTEEVDGDTKSMSDDNEELEEDSSEPEVIGLLLHQEGEEGEQEEITVHLDSSGMVVMPPGDSTPQDNSDDITIVDEDGSLSSLPAEPLAEGSIGGSPGAGIDGDSLGGNTLDDEAEESAESGTVGGEGARIKLEINSDGTLGAIPVSISGAHGIQSISLQSLGLQNGQGVPMGALQAYAMPDGTTAFLQQQVTLKGDDKNFEGHTVQLPDGSTAIVQSVADSEKGDLGGSTSNMESPFAQNSAKGLEGIHAVQLEDGTMAYLTAAHLFDEHGHLDPQAVALEQLQQQQGVQPELENDEAGSAAVPGTSAGGVKRGTAALPLPGPRTAIKGSVQNLLAAAQATPEDRIALANRMEKISQLNSKAYKCTFEGCERLYTTQHHLRVHQRSHTGDRPFKCEFAECGKAFATGYGLKSHIRVHTGEKPYKCPETNCSKAFKTSGDLQKHIRIHTGERPFKCPFSGCFRSFTTSNIRKVHIRTHTGERPYICEEEGCRKAFASATNYKNHIRIHTGEKPYVCTVQGCGKRFTEYSSLYKHHVVHTHSKPYVCNHCGKTYRQTSTLAMHRRTAHGEDLTADTDGTLVFASQEVTLGGLSKGQAGDKNVPVRIQLVQAGDAAIAQGDTGKELVINTSEGQPVTLTDSASLEGGKITLSGSEQQQMVTMASPHLLQQLQGQAITLAGDGSGGQQIYVVTDPSQLEALQQLAAQQQQQQQQAALAENVPQAEQTVSEMNVEGSHNGANLGDSRGESDLDSSMQETGEDADTEQQHVVMVTADPEGQSTTSSKEQVTVVKHGEMLYVTDSS